MTTNLETPIDGAADADEVRQAFLLVDAVARDPVGLRSDIKVETLPSAIALLNAPPRIQLKAMLKIHAERSYRWRMAPIQTILIGRNLPWRVDEIEALVENAAAGNYWSGGWETVIRLLQCYVAQGRTLTPTTAAGLRTIRNKLDSAPGGEPLKQQILIDRLFGEDQEVLPDPCEAWAELVRADIAALPPAQQTAWKRLLAQMQIVDGSKPATAWRKEAKTRLSAVGEAEFRQSIARWFGSITVPPMVNTQYEDGGRTWEISQSSGTERNTNILKGLA